MTSEASRTEASPFNVAAENCVRSIKEPRRFSRAYSRGKKCGTYHAAIYAIKPYGKQAHGGVLLGLSVSKKIGSAVARNRVKRIFRAGFVSALQKLREDGKTIGGWDIVLAARTEAVTAKSTDVEKSLLYAIGKLGIARDINRGAPGNKPAGERPAKDNV